VESIFPEIDVSRVSREFFAARHDFLGDLPALLSAFKEAAARPPSSVLPTTAT
jgi:hypothetical protein